MGSSGSGLAARQMERSLWFMSDKTIREHVAPAWFINISCPGLSDIHHLLLWQSPCIAELPVTGGIQPTSPGTRESDLLLGSTRLLSGYEMALERGPEADGAF